MQNDSSWASPSRGGPKRVSISLSSGAPTKVSRNCAELTNVLNWRCMSSKWGLVMPHWSKDLARIFLPYKEKSNDRKWTFRSATKKKHRLHVRERRLSRLHNQKQEAAKRKTGGGQKPAENSDNGRYHFVDEKSSFCDRCISNADLNYSPRRFAPKAVQVS